MTVESPNSNTTPDPTHHHADPDASRQLTAGILSLALGLTALTGGGVLSNAIQWWTVRLTYEDQLNSFNGGVGQVLVALPAILIGAVAIALGLSAARSSTVWASAIGKSGALIGCLAIVGGVLYAVAMYSSSVY